MSSRRQELLSRVNWYPQSSIKHITELITDNKFYHRGGRYRQVSLYLCLHSCSVLFHHQQSRSLSELASSLNNQRKHKWDPLLPSHVPWSTQLCVTVIGVFLQNGGALCNNERIRHVDIITVSFKYHLNHDFKYTIYPYAYSALICSITLHEYLPNRLKSVPCTMIAFGMGL